jgi:RimJ/RimL family protein N-acetyltransferase
LEGKNLEASWTTPSGSLVVTEPSTERVRDVAEALAGFYNEPTNARLLSNTLVFTAADVVELWRDARLLGSRSFLLWCDDALVGDADFRNVGGGAAELAILIGPRERQGQGLGGRFVSMLLALGVVNLGIERFYVAIRPENAVSLRLFARAGFTRDETLAGRSYAEENDDVCMVLGREAVLTHHKDALGAIKTPGTSC